MIASSALPSFSSRYPVLASLLRKTLGDLAFVALGEGRLGVSARLAPPVLSLVTTRQVEARLSQEQAAELEEALISLVPGGDKIPQHLIHEIELEDRLNDIPTVSMRVRVQTQKETNNAAT